MKNIIFAVGARPNFIKLAPLVRAFQESDYRARIVHTGQHYDTQMSDVFFQELGIPEPEAHLEVGSASHGAQTGRILEAFERLLIISTQKPAAVVVVGDVNSTLACALAAAKLCIPVVHIEAGLRSFDRSMPEEVNRVMTDSIADLLFVSEPSGLTNLLNEGIQSRKIHFVGNLMIDTLVHELAGARATYDPKARPYASYGFLTVHRPSNVDCITILYSLVDFICTLSTRLPIVFPIHPRTRLRLEENGLMSRLLATPTIHLMGPLGYRENLSAIAGAQVVLTDSGGIQEETSFLGIPCVTLRDSTERPVTLTHGTNVLVGTDFAKARNIVENIIGGRRKRGSPIPLWDGHTAERIRKILLEYLGGHTRLTNEHEPVCVSTATSVQQSASSILSPSLDPSNNHHGRGSVILEAFGSTILTNS